MIKFLTLQQLLRLHDAVIEKFGGLKGVRDLNLLASAVETPKATMFGEFLHSTTYDKAAAYLFHIVRNHPFNDGNKRTGAGAAYLFLEINKVPVLFESCFENEIYEDLVVKVAMGKRTKEQIAYFFEHGQEGD
ncbi:MAG: type II toxin-antitoxin system death-on-curing family toxin [Chlamydiales bacterium]